MINLKRKEWLLLSRYVDGDLSAEQVRRIEKRLRSDAALKQAYERMLHTRQVLRSVPLREIPHSYTLSASMVEVEHQAKTSQGIWRFSSAAAAVVAVLAMFLQIFSPRASIINTAADSVQAEERVLAVPESDEGGAATEEPQIIQWESGAYGMGGGGGNGDTAAVPETSPAATGFYGIGGGGSAEQPSPTDDLLAKELEGSASDTAAEPAQSSQEQTTGEDPNPILGISPQEERGAVQSEDAGNVLLDDAASKSAFQWDFGKIAIGSAVVSLICGVVAFILHRKKRS